MYALAAALKVPLPMAVGIMEFCDGLVVRERIYFGEPWEPPAWRAKWVERFANLMGIQAAFVFKRRQEEGTEVTAVSAQVAGKRVVIYDDMIRTGGSLIAAARAYKEAGAASISAVATHGVLPGDASQRIQDSGLFEKLAITDSHPRALAVRSDFIEVIPVAPVLAAALTA